MCAATSVAVRPVRFIDSQTERWFWAESPCHWPDHSSLEFDYVPLSSLESGGSFTHNDVVRKWRVRIEEGRAIPPLVVSKTDHGTFYVHDGNHRLRALKSIYCEELNLAVRVARVVPAAGYCFRFRRYRGHATYRLEPNERPTSKSHTKMPVPTRLVPLANRTMVLVAHPDDETGGCAGLLQRMSEPIVLFATEGAPSAEYFWNRFSSSQVYSRVRRNEAFAALSKAGVKKVGFLGDWVCEGEKLQDQELFKFIGLAYRAAAGAVERFHPDAILVPAYEGGHPDHDACSFLGYLLKCEFGIEVWEMPLYHRASSGDLVCRRFRTQDGTETALTLTIAELETRRRMLSDYSSQWDLNEYVSTAVEYFRPQLEYDFSCPPHSGLLNYQVWQWPVTPSVVCRAFQSACQSCIQAADNSYCNLHSEPSPDQLNVSCRAIELNGEHWV